MFFALALTLAAAPAPAVPAARPLPAPTICSRNDTTLIAEKDGTYRLLMFVTSPTQGTPQRAGDYRFDPETTPSLAVGYRTTIDAEGKAAPFAPFKVTIGGGRFDDARPELGALRVRLEAGPDKDVELRANAGVFSAGYVRANLALEEYQYDPNDAIVSGLDLQALVAGIETGISRVTVFEADKPLAKYLYARPDSRAKQEALTWSRVNIVAIRTTGRCA